VYTEYAKAPEVTRQRMYLETMQQVYSNTSKVMVDAKGQGNLLYLPLDKLMQATAAATAAQAAPEASVAPSTAKPSAALSSEAPPQLETAPKVGGGSYSGSSREGSLRSRDREGR
jgi:membrane protease subunit HflK